MDVDFLQPVRNMSVHIKVFKRDYSNKYQPFLVDVVVNMCDIIGRRNYSPYGRYLWGLFKRYTNFNHSCPFVGHMFARGIFIDESVVPVKLPLGDYQIVLFPFETYREKPPQSIGSIKFNAQAMVPVIPKRNRTNPTDRTTSRAPQTVIVPVKNGK
ncbi:uncharacterized protein LOC117889887 [Drosophila subobscura]|uniref:uncharacterized protein LOC117889887 n=1 Tax=Drosophila subobscura TaxID=7241 RepID=UPI00155A7155|nr:uncharacterized protein LOC117889887 [Drosophila subobscura]